MSLSTPYYQDEAVTIYHGDCRDILPSLPKVDLVLTDPPYGIGIADWDAFIEPNTWMPLLPCSAILVFPSIGRMYSYPQPRWVLSWIRDNSTQRNGTGGFNHWEPVLVYGCGKFSKDSIRSLDHGGHDFHPSVKPLNLLRWLIEEAEAQTILDPFMGSGTTLRAAKDLGRKAIGIEIKEKYCAIAAKRMSQSVMDLRI
jgi:site-specific DNA-methyltransferase (adenine-specific)